jgi:ribokinase
MQRGGTFSSSVGWRLVIPVLIAVYSSNGRERVAANILVVGSVNADTFLPVARLPVEGENLTLLPNKFPVTDVPGGKGCTQAVAASKLYRHGIVSFLGQFGNDRAAETLQDALREAGVGCDDSGHHSDLPSGRGYVFLAKSGQVSAVVSGGSNQYGWKEWEEAWEKDGKDTDGSISVLEGKLDKVLGKEIRCVMMQREVPEYVNLLVASYCKRQRKDVVVVQDVGGEDRPIDPEMLSCIDYLMPNESELRRLVLSDDTTIEQTHRLSVVELIEILQKRGARNVLVTQGDQGSTLVSETGEVFYQPAFSVPEIVDETGAGDCYRAAFVTALLEGRSLRDCMRFASAAGSCSVEKSGAVPSTPSLREVEERFHALTEPEDVEQSAFLSVPRGDGLQQLGVSRGGSTSPNDDFPYLIGSRLNSMKDRPDLWNMPLQNPRDYVRRQATIRGLTCVDFNYPQHFHSWSNQEARAALDEAGVVAGAVCLRYPERFARGAMNNPDADLRREAVELTKAAAQTALDLGCSEVVVWSAFDGYDYPFQVDYDVAWNQLVDAFRECCDMFPTVKFSLEYKPTDENTRFFTVPSTGAAMLLVGEVDRSNFGLTLDVGHMLMSGEVGRVFVTFSSCVASHHHYWNPNLTYTVCCQCCKEPWPIHCDGRTGEEIIWYTAKRWVHTTCC